jgi:hypothetical protein
MFIAYLAVIGLAVTLVIGLRHARGLTTTWRHAC